MRKSNNRSRTRLVGAGIAAAAVSAVVMVAPEAAWAAGTPSPYVVAPGGVVAVTDASYTFAAGHVAEFETTCGAHYTATNTTSTFAQGAANTQGGTAHVINVTVPTGIAVAANGAGKAYNLCVYDTNSPTGSLLQTSAPVFVAAVPTVSPLLGPTAGTNLLTVDAATASPVFTAPTTVGVTFTTGSCPTTYGTPATGMAATDVTKVSNTELTFTVPSGVATAGAGTAAYNACFYNGTATSGALLTAVPYTVSNVLLSQNSGPSGGGNGLSINSVDTSLFGGITPGIVFVQAADCSAQAHYTTSPVVTPGSEVYPVLAANTRKLSDSQLALTVPNTVTNTTSGNWQACIYNSNTSGSGTLIASAPYAVAAPSIPTLVSPAAGPTTGKTTITVYGSGFPLPTDLGTISATLGGVPLNNVTKKSATSFTATTPPHSPDPSATLVVTTDTGTQALQNAFAYQNALTLKPNTAPNTSAGTDIQVSGSGFLGYSFGSTGTAARVWLVRGTYNASDAGSTTYANGPVQECGDVLILGDNSLICTLPLNRRMTSAGTVFNPATYTNTTNTSGPGATPVAASKVIDATAGSFSQDDLGQAISDGAVCIPADTTVTAVLSSTRLVMSNAATCATPVPNLTIGGTAVHSFTTTLSVAAGDLGTLTTTSANPFTQADVGRVLKDTATDTAITPGTTITAVAPNGLSATLSAPASGALSGVNGAFWPAAPVPNGAYTMTVVTNGAVDANTTDPTYQQSAVTSGATFTVAPA